MLNLTGNRAAEGSSGAGIGEPEVEARVGRGKEDRGSNVKQTGEHREGESYLTNNSAAER